MRKILGLGIMLCMLVMVGCGSPKNEGATASVTDNTTVNAEKVTEPTTADSPKILSDNALSFVYYSMNIPNDYTQKSGSGYVLRNINRKYGPVYCSRVLDNDKDVVEVSDETLSATIKSTLYINLKEYMEGDSMNATVEVLKSENVDVNGVKMKKFTASANMGEYLKPENTWDCYVYGYVFNTQDKYVDKTNKQPHILYGVVPGHSQDADQIAEVQKNMDAMVKTIKVID